MLLPHTRAHMSVEIFQGPQQCGTGPRYTPPARASEQPPGPTQSVLVYQLTPRTRRALSRYWARAFCDARGGARVTASADTDKKQRSDGGGVRTRGF